MRGTRPKPCLHLSDGLPVGLLDDVVKGMPCPGVHGLRTLVRTRASGSAGEAAGVGRATLGGGSSGCTCVENKAHQALARNAPSRRHRRQRVPGAAAWCGAASLGQAASWAALAGRTRRVSSTESCTIHCIM